MKKQQERQRRKSMRVFRPKVQQTSNTELPEALQDGSHPHVYNSFLGCFKMKLSKWTLEGSR